MSDWIPIKFHTITEEERKEKGYPSDWVIFMDNPMPDDGEEILISCHSIKGAYFVEKDTNYNDGYFYLDSGMEWVDVDAWMPLPEPYKKEKAE